MCRGRLVTSSCSCGCTDTRIKMSKMDCAPATTSTVDTYHSEVPPTQDQLKTKDRSSHRKSFVAIRRRVSKPRPRHHVKSNSYVGFPSVYNDSENKQVISSNTSYQNPLKRGGQQNTLNPSPTGRPACPRTRSQPSLHAIIPAPILEKDLEEEEYIVRILSENEEEKEFITERVTKDDCYRDNGLTLPLPLSPLELIGLDSDSTQSDSSSVVDLDSVLLDVDDSTDVGPEPTVVYEENPTQCIKNVTFRERSVPRCRSMSDVHRQIHVIDELLFSIDLEYGASDIGPEPEVLFDDLPENKAPITTAECTREQLTDNPASSDHKSARRGSDSAAIIDSIFATKQQHSCCKNRRKLSWNATKRAQLKQVPRRRPRKIVVVGDMCSGKSALISAYCKDRFNETYVPTILRSCLTDADLQGETIELVVIEVSGREDYVKLRQCAYRKTDAVVLCYSCDNFSSLEKIKSHWLPEIYNSIPNVPYILVGTKKDIRDEILEQLEVVTEEEKSQSLKTSASDLQAIKGKLASQENGYEMSEAIGALSFLECSARYRDGTRNVFETVAKIAMQKSRRKRKVQRTGDVCAVM